MRLSTSNNVTFRSASRNESKILASHTVPPNQEVDLGIFGAKEIRDIIKSKAHCLQAGFSSDDIIIKTLDEIRVHYIKKVGLPTYLSQMLGGLGQVQIQHCRLFRENGQQIEMHLNGNYSQPVQRFVAKHFRIDQLPFRVEIYRESNPGQIEVRYL